MAGLTNGILSKSPSIEQVIAVDALLRQFVSLHVSLLKSICVMFASAVERID
jgi:hypothetical protein